MRRLAIAAAALALLAGCNDQGEVTTTVDTGNMATATAGANTAATGDAATGETTGEAHLQVAPDGIGYVYPDGRSGRAGFGTGETLALQMATSALGEPVHEATNPECGAGPLKIVTYEGGFAMLIQDGKFVGWSLGGDDSLLTTASGIGVGTTRSEMEESVTIEMRPESTLGTEFAIGGMGGLLTGTGPDAVVTDLWAGTTCMFR